MASLNKVTIIGFLGRDPEKRYTPAGSPVTNINVATTERWRDKSTGELKSSTEWHQISFFGPMSENVAKLLKKGSQVYLEGRLHTNEYKDKDGLTRSNTVIYANTFQILDRKSDAETQSETIGKKTSSSKSKNGVLLEPSNGDFVEDDIPF